VSEDLGLVSPGKPGVGVATLQLTNDTKTRWVIDDASPRCMLRIARPIVIAAGETAPVEIIVSTLDPGAQTVEGLFLLSEPADSVLVVSCTYVVPGALEVVPPALALMATEPSGKFAGAVRIMADRMLHEPRLVVTDVGGACLAEVSVQPIDDSLAGADGVRVCGDVSIRGTMPGSATEISFVIEVLDAATAGGEVLRVPVTVRRPRECPVTPDMVLVAQDTTFPQTYTFEVGGRQAAMDNLDFALYPLGANELARNGDKLVVTLSGFDGSGAVDIVVSRGSTIIQDVPILPVAITED